MAMQKSSGAVARSIGRGQKYLISVVFVVVCLVLFQFWTYDQTWSPDHPNSRTGSRKGLRAILMKSWEDYGIDNNRDLDTLLKEITTLCNSSSGRDDSLERGSKTSIEECLKKLRASFPLLQPSPIVVPAPEPCKTGVYTERITALERDVDTLNVSLKNSTKSLELETGAFTKRITGLENDVNVLGDSLRNSTVFLALKDTRESGLTDKDSTWFMSSVLRTKKNTGISEEFEFPSEMSQGRLLCLMGNNRSDGTQNKYGFAWKGYLPDGAKLLPGLTLVADNYWDYTNIWHAMSALTGFVSWGTRNGCTEPERVLLYHWGEHVPSMGLWIDNVLHASFGRKLEVEAMEQQKGSVGGPIVCLERAIVIRRGLGRVSKENMNAMFETIRCKTRKYCGVVMPEATHPHNTSITLLLRSGARSFKNATAVQTTIERACEKVGNCHLEVAYASNLSFCEQVSLMSRTDVLVTTHGAQMTNMMFMSKGGSIMELIPKGWLEYAGVGQYIYSWLSSWANLHYEGVWRDPEGPDCPHPTTETLACLLFHKGSQVGHNETHLAEWTRTVLKNFGERKDSTPPPPESGVHCPCDKSHIAATHK